jgi:hypothetical protein
MRIEPPRALTSGGRAILPLLVGCLLASWAAPVLAQPGYFNLESPSHNGVWAWTDSLRWAASPDAASFTVELRVAGGSTWWKVPRGTQRTFGHSPDTLDELQGKAIEWRVEACTAGTRSAPGQCRYNNGNPWTAYVPLACAALVGPEHGTTASSRRPTFRWRGRPGAQSYQVFVNGSSVGAIGGAGPGESTTTIRELTPSQDLVGSQAVWFVKSCYSGGSTSVCCEPLPSAGAGVKNTLYLPSSRAGGSR